MQYIVLLRGINVSGQKKIKMEDLRAMCTNIGCENVKTYIQSGNLVLESSATSTTTIAEEIHQALQTTFGFDIPVMAFKAEAWQTTLDYNPFLEADSTIDIKHLLVTFLDEEPTAENLAKVAAIKLGADQWKLVDNRIYLYCPNGYGRSKLTNTVLEQKLKVRATTRNWRSIHKIHALL